MIELTSLDLRYAARELSQLVGAKVEKVFQSDAHKRDLFFIMYLQGSPKVHLRFLLPGFVCMPKEKPIYPQQPPGFSMFLRKYLSGTRLQAVRQRGFDRIIDLEFASKTDVYTLTIEFMAPGNMLLLDKEGKIINLLENQQFKDRSLRARQGYVPPPSTDITQLSPEELASRITVSTRDSIVTTLAITCSLGGIYAEEVCARANIAKHRNDLSAAEISALVKIIFELLNEPLAAHTDGQRIYPFKLQSRQTHPCEKTSFLATLSSTVTEEPLLDKIEARARVRDSPQTKLQAIINAQSAQVARFESEITQTQRKGEKIYEEYRIVQQILEAARHAREKKQDIAAALAAFPQVKNYRPETGEIELELEGE